MAANQTTKKSKANPGHRTPKQLAVAIVWILIILKPPTLAGEQEQHSGANYLLPDEVPVNDDDRAHWAFQPLVQVPLPSVKHGRWVINPIDRFVLSRLEQNELEPLPPPDRHTLVRRLSFDLTGLPPQPSEVEAFVSDSSRNAYERLVDRLLASPAYGERCAQHWLDLARFAETDGFEHDKTRKEAWRYRDWVVEAFNQDLPYDRFIHLQLAGDELLPGDPTAIVATAFCLSGPDMPDINSQEERRHNLLNELTSTVGSVFLGLQLECAQCHDHKFDPVSQADFYRLRAVFSPAVHVQRNKSIATLQDHGVAASPDYLMIRGDWHRRGPKIVPAFPRIANPWNDRVSERPDASASGGRRTALARWLTRKDHPLTSRVIVNRLWQQHFGRGLSESASDFGMMGDAPTHPRLLDWLATELVRQDWSLKAIHRLIVSSATYRQASRPHATSWSEEQSRRAKETWHASVSADPRNRWLARFPLRRLDGETIRDAMLQAAGALNRQRGGPGIRPPLPKELVATLLRNQWDVSPDTADHDRRSIYLFARRNLRYPIFDVFDRPDGNASCACRDRSTTAVQSLLMLNSEFSLRTAQRLAGRALCSVSDMRLSVENARGRKSPADGPTCWQHVATGDSDWRRCIDEQIGFVFRQTLCREPTEAELDAGRSYLSRQRQLMHSEQRAPEELALATPFPPGADPHAAAALTDLCLAVFNLNEFVYVD